MRFWVYGAWFVAVMSGAGCVPPPSDHPTRWDPDVLPPTVHGREIPVRRGAVASMSGAVTSIVHDRLSPRDALRVDFEPRVRLAYDLSKLDPIARAKESGWKPGENDVYDHFRKARRIGVEIDQQRFVERDLTSIDPGGTRRAAYLGVLHSHTSLSDGSGTPGEAFAMARDVGGMDFFGVSEHAEYFIGPLAGRWDALRAAADEATGERFVALAGFEYSNLWWGHYGVLNSAEYFPYRYWSWGVGAFYDWLAEPARRDALAVFCHPGFHVNHMPFEHDSFRMDRRLVDRFVGVEVTHMGAWLPDVTGRGHGMSFYDEALSRGWRVGPMASPDNHEANWGVRDGHRIGVLLNRLGRDELIEAVRARRFYATTNEGMQASWGMWLRGGGWAAMGERVARDAADENRWELEFRYADASSKHAPRVFEVLVDGRVAGRLRYPALPDPPSGVPWWAIWSRPAERVDLDPMTPPQAGAIRVGIDPRLLDPRRAHVVTARFLQGRRGQHYTVTAPIFVE